MITTILFRLQSIIRAQYIPLHMHPLFHSMYTLMLGILAGRACFMLPITIKIYALIGLTVSVALIALQAYWRRGTAACTFSLYLGCAFIIGCVRIQQRMAYFYNAEAHCTNTLTVEGTILEHAAIEHPLIKDSITLRIDAIASNPSHPLKNMIVKLYCARKTAVSVADHVRIENIRIKQPAKEEFAWYLIKEGFAGTAFLPCYRGILIERPVRSLQRWIDESRSAMLSGVCSSIDRSTQALYSSLFLGNRSTKKEELDTVADEFKLWGISHYLARSGLHMVIFASLWSVILNLLPVAHVLKVILLCVITAVYTGLSWSSISFIRALSAFLAYKLYSILRLPAHSVHVFSLVCCFILFDNPAQLFFLDFQLSFGLTFGIAWFYHTYGAYLRRLKSMQYARTVE